MKLILATALLLSWIPRIHHTQRIMPPIHTAPLKVSFQLVIETHCVDHRRNDPILSIKIKNITLRSRWIPINATLYS